MGALKLRTIIVVIIRHKKRRETKLVKCQDDTKRCDRKSRVISLVMSCLERRQFDVVT
jgi:hypothetical protein